MAGSYFANIVASYKQIVTIRTAIVRVGDLSLQIDSEG
jgi:hypothetical protein